MKSVSKQVLYFFIIKSSLSILDNSPLLDMSFTNMFSQSAAYLFIPSHRAEIFNFNEVQLINSSLMDQAFQVVSKNLSSNPRPPSLSPSSERLLPPRNDLVVTVGHIPSVARLMAAFAQISASACILSPCSSALPFHHFCALFT